MEEDRHGALLAVFEKIQNERVIKIEIGADLTDTSTALLFIKEELARKVGLRAVPLGARVNITEGDKPVGIFRADLKDILYG